ncbi:YhgE/Pip domain-containing protein [Nocardia asteroides]|uniref:YhgE/Pip domain-containing protein n=1 Tax=Nocardia asteroides TaxID=1824 RepID=UPI0037C7380D
MAIYARHLPSRWIRSRIARLVLAVVITLPLTMSAVYMWGMWDPTKKVGELPVALVNSDQPVDSGGKRIAAGEQVADSLLKSKPVAFERLGRDAAMAGLESGRYYFMVEIPENFSRSIAGLSQPTADPARIEITYNDNNTLLASSIGARIMTAVENGVRKAMAGQAVGSVLSGLDTLGTGMKSAGAGATQLSDGTTRLAAGAGTLADGLRTQLAPGMESAASGSRQIATGAGEFATGLEGLQNGTSKLGNGAQSLADGISRLTSAVDADGVLSARLSALLAQLESNPDGLSREAAMLLSQLTTILNGLQQLETGSSELARQLNDPAADYRGAIDKLATGGQTLAQKTDQLATGLDRLNGGMRSAEGGVVQLHTGLESAAAGATQLAAGLTDGASRLPDFSVQAERENIATLLATPVVAVPRNVAPAKDLGPGAAPTLLAIFTALLSILVWMTFRAHHQPQEQTSTSHSAARRVLAVAGASLALMLVVAAALWISLSPAPDPADLGVVIAVVGLATLMSVALVSAAYAVFGYTAGTLLALALLMLQTFSYGGIWMVETVPGPFRLFHYIAPLTYVRDGLVAGFNGSSGFLASAVVMIAITLSALGITAAFEYKGWSRYPYGGRRSDGSDQTDLVAVASPALLGRDRR